MTHLGAALTPFSTRMRQRFVLPPPEKKVDWTPRLQVGDAGVRDGSLICSCPSAVGPVFYGPYTHLYPGIYRLKLKFSRGSPLDSSSVGELASSRSCHSATIWGMASLPHRCQEARIRHGLHCDRRSVGRSRVHHPGSPAHIFPRRYGHLRNDLRTAFESQSDRTGIAST